ncbi:hypothetical protein ALISP_1054 [Alicycliphilus sp. B1]|nr:hypothetical protein ALISP_1054 [Alicycliphilus sp. B1]
MPNTQDDDFDLDKCLDEFELKKLNPSPQPVSPIQELVQSVAASIPPITPAAPSKAAQWKEMISAQARAQKRLNELAKNDPEFSSISNESYGMRFEVTPFMKAKEGTGKVFQAIIGHILTQSGAVKSQTEIRNYVAERFPSYSIPKDWTQTLPEWAVKKIQKRIRNSAVPIANIQLPKAVTLSQLHKAAAAAIERHKNGVQTFKPMVEVSDTCILINGISFPIGTNKVGGQIYKQMRASMPKLIQALASRNTPPSKN